MYSLILTLFFGCGPELVLEDGCPNPDHRGVVPQSCRVDYRCESDQVDLGLLPRTPVVAAAPR